MAEKTLVFGQMKKSRRQNEVIVKLPDGLKNTGNWENFQR
jgi:hypothetical protein